MILQTPILVTGASGFIGANLLRRLLSEVPSYKVHVLLRKESNTWRINDVLKKVPVHVVDLKNQQTAEQLLRKIKPKTIFHLATHGAYSHQQLDEREILETNIICTFNLLQASLQVGFDSFINTGTSSEYGINMKQMSEGDVLTPITAYGTSKAWATFYSRYLALTQKVPITTLRLFGVYGFYQPQGQLIPNVILSLLNSKRSTLTAPHFARDFVFVDDVVNAYFRATEHHFSESVFNIGSGKPTTLKEVFNVIRDIIGVDIEPVLDSNTSYLFDPNRRIANIKLARKYLKWEPKTDLHDGLQQTINWFKRNIALYQ